MVHRTATTGRITTKIMPEVNFFNEINEGFILECSWILIIAWQGALARSS